MKETINIKGKEFDVYFDYQPEEKEVRYYSDGSGYPGCPAEYQIKAIEYKGEDWTEFFDYDNDYNMIIEKLEELREWYKHNY